MTSPELRNYAARQRKIEKQSRIQVMTEVIKIKFPGAKFSVDIKKGKFIITGLTEDQLSQVLPASEK